MGGFGIALLGSATGVYVLAATAALLCFILTLAIKAQKSIRATELISFKALAAGAKFVWQNQLILAAMAIYHPGVFTTVTQSRPSLIVVSGWLIWPGIRKSGALQEYK